MTLIYSSLMKLIHDKMYPEPWMGFFAATRLLLSSQSLSPLSWAHRVSLARSTNSSVSCFFNTGRLSTTLVQFRVTLEWILVQLGFVTLIGPIKVGNYERTVWSPNIIPTFCLSEINERHYNTINCSKMFIYREIRIDLCK